MKRRIALTTLIIAMMLLMCAFLIACETEGDDVVTIKKVEIAKKQETPYILGEAVDLSAITLRVIFSSGEEQTVTVTDHMFSASDRNLFITKGTYTVYINYENFIIPLQIIVKEPTLPTEYRATFHSNGGNDIPPRTASVIDTFRAPYRANYDFLGWYTNSSFEGDAAVAPYTMSGNTDFYAKWQDQRRCTVSFLDEGLPFVTPSGQSVIEIVYGTGIDLSDYETYGRPSDKEGKIFDKWVAENAEVSNITNNIVVKASYTTVQCTVRVEHKTGSYQQTQNYGSVFDLSGYELEQKEGHVSRWVVYINQSTTYVELSAVQDGLGRIILKENLIVIKAEHEVNTYIVSIYNRAAIQTDANIKAGSIQLERVLNNNNEFILDYNDSLLFKSYTQNPYLVTPLALDGYNAVWCFVTRDKDGREIWRNAQNEVWNESAGSFVLLPGEERTINFMLTDANGDVIARISDGDIYDIKGDVTVRAKYTKKSYRITLKRLVGGIYQDLSVSFTREYKTDFRLYDPNLPEYTGMNTWMDVYKSYLWSIPADFLNTDAEWDIEWYTNSNHNVTGLVEFDYKVEDNALGAIEINQDLILYAKDIDLRTYEAILHYSYNFDSGTYALSKTYVSLPESSQIEVPEPATAPITYRQVVYTFAGWFDYPYEGPNTAYEGTGYPSIDRRTRNMVYYAHYQNSTTYTLTINDKTQREAYKGNAAYENAGYAVYDDTIVYLLSSGTEVTIDMIFKGLGYVSGGSVVSGQRYYEQYATILYYENVYLPLYNSLLSTYGSGVYETALSAIRTKVTQWDDVIKTYEDLLVKIYQYDYTYWEQGQEKAMTEAYYNGVLANLGVTGSVNRTQAYNTARYTRYLYQQELAVLENYSTLTAVYYDYKNEQSKGTYKPYSESENHLNEGGTGEYKFAGWFLDSAYTEPFLDADNDKVDSFCWTANGNLTLYAKWVDIKKGSEGLIFELVQDVNMTDYLLVVAFLNRSQFDASIYAGTKYNQFTPTKPYSVNLDDQDNMPSSLGTVIELQIPATHAGRPVIGISADAFKSNGTAIFSISLPNEIKFLEEGAFNNCNFTSISYVKDQLDDSNNYLNVDNERAVYQAKDYTLNLEKSYVRNVLIAYAGSAAANAYTVLPGTERIADSAFLGARNLKSISFSDTLVSIGNNAFNGSALTGAVTFPDSLTTIGIDAFKSCGMLSNVIVGAGSSLQEVKRGALTTTGWYLEKAGIITLNGILLGIREGDESDYLRDSNGYIFSEFGEYIIESGLNKIYFNTSGILTRLVIGEGIRYIAEYALYGENILQYADVNASALIRIYDNAFQNCSAMLSLYLRNATDGISFGQNVFAGCVRGMNLLFPHVVGSSLVVHYRTVQNADGFNAFVNFGALDASAVLREFQTLQSTVVLPYFVEAIGANVFENSEISEITLPDSVTKIEEYAFKNAAKIATMSLPATLTDVGLGAFYGMAKLVRLFIPFIGDKLELPNYTHIGYLFGTLNASENNTYVPSTLKTLQIHTTSVLTGSTPVAVSIGDNAFSGLVGVDAVTLGTHIASIGEYAFYQMRALTSLTVPQNVAFIGDYAFSGNVLLRSLVFSGNLLTSVGEYAFENCTELTTLTFPSALTDMGFGALSGTSKLKSLSIPFVGSAKSTPGSLGYLFGAVDYQTQDTAVPNALTSLIVIETAGNINIGDFAFYGLSALQTVTLGNNVINIGQSAFEDCTSIEQFILPKNVLTVGASAFKGMNLLRSFDFAENSVLTDLGQNAFEDAVVLSSLTLPDTVQTIGAGAFKGMVELSSLTVPFIGTERGVNDFIGKQFGASVYTENGQYLPTTLTAFVITDMTAVAASAFYGAEFVETISLPATVAVIGEAAFEGTKSLSSVTVSTANTDFVVTEGVLHTADGAELILYPAKKSGASYAVATEVRTIRTLAFSENKELETLTVPLSVTAIESSAFKNTALVSLTVPFVGTDGTGVFGTVFGASDYGTHMTYVPASLKDVIVLGGTSVVANAFRGIENLERLTVPHTVAAIGASAFEGCISLAYLEVPFIGGAVSGGTAYFSYTFGGGNREANDSAVPSALKEFVLTEGTTAFGLPQYAFYKCVSLTSITLSSSVESLTGNTEFLNCTALTELVINGENPPTAYAEILFSNSPLLSAIYVPAPNQYQTTLYWSVLGVLFKPLSDR